MARPRKPAEQTTSAIYHGADGTGSPGSPWAADPTAPFQGRFDPLSIMNPGESVPLPLPVTDAGAVG